MPETEANAPEGFKEMRAYGGFHKTNGPFFTAKRGENVVVGMRLEERHGNAIGSAHGGLLMTLVDTALTLAAGRAAPKGQYAVTAGLNADFLSPGTPGDWIEAEVEVLRAGRSSIALDCRVRRDGPEGKLLMRAAGSFHVVAGG